MLSRVTDTATAVQEGTARRAVSPSRRKPAANRPGRRFRLIQLVPRIVPTVLGDARQLLHGAASAGAAPAWPDAGRNRAGSDRPRFGDGRAEPVRTGGARTDECAGNGYCLSAACNHAPHRTDMHYAGSPGSSRPRPRPAHGLVQHTASDLGKLRALTLTDRF